MWIVYIILSSLFSSIMTILIKVGVKNIDSVLLLTLRSSIVFIILWCIIFIYGKNSEIKNITKKEWVYIFVIAIATALTWIFYFLAINKSSVTKVIAMEKISIIITVILSAIFLKEKITIMTIIGFVVLLFGSLLIVFG